MEEENNDNQIPQSLTEALGHKITMGAEKTKSFSSACIYRVPEELRKIKESAYKPRCVSIGPLHSKDNRLKSPMQDIKMSYVNSLICRVTGGSEDRKFTVLLEECIEAMKRCIVNAKKCYAEEVQDMDDEMLLVDGCFILELLYRCHLINNPKGKLHGESEKLTSQEPKNVIDDPIFESSLMLVTVEHDLLLLENQLPFLVLEELFRLTVEKITDRDPSLSLVDYVRFYFSYSFGLQIKSTTSNGRNCSPPSECVVPMNLEDQNAAAVPKEKSKKVYNHFLHFLHDCCCPRDPPPAKAPTDVMPSASNLDYAGVKFLAITEDDLFKVKFTEAQGHLERYFRRARFEISTLTVDESTEPFLRNLIAFEQCCPRVSPYFTSYAFLMDMLVNSKKDVEVLQKAAVIRKPFGTDEDAADLFNNLCQGVVIDKFYFTEMCNQATKYSERHLPKALAHMRRQYFATPWTFIAFCVAFMAFGITVTNFIRNWLK